MRGNHFRFAPIKLGAVTLAAAVIAAVSGCRDSDRLKTYSVTGKVTFSDGKPWPKLEGGSITFHSIEHEELSATGAIEPDGTFQQLTTYEPGDGVVAGTHRVAIRPPVRTDVDYDEVRVRPLIHPRFQDPETSLLEFTVTEEGPNDASIRVERP